MNLLWEEWQITAAHHPDKPVVIEADTDRVWTCAELSGAVESRRVTAFNLPNGAAWLIQFIAIQRAAGIAAPLDPSLTGEAFERVARTLSRLRFPEATCCLKLTSGTTGKLKPIPCTAAHLLADGKHIIKTMGIRSRDRNLAIIPLGHSYGLGNLVMPLLMQATPVVCTSSLVPRHVLELIEQHRVTVLPTVPAVLRALAQTKGAKRPASLRLVISAGAPLSPEVARQFYDRYGLKIHNFYGASETGGICYDRTGNASLSGRSVGKPLVGVKIRVRRDDRIVVGNQVLSDLGEWNRYGELKLLGRVGQIANIGGKKVSPAEIETCLRHVRCVSDAWVTVLQDRRGNDYMAAAVETTRAREDIETELGERLAAWKLPRRYFLRPTLPRSERGKLKTEELKSFLRCD